MVKNGRNPAPVSAGKNVKEMTNYYLVVRGNKHFYPDVQTLIRDALAGVA